MAEPIVPKRFGPPLGMYSHGMIVRGGELVVVAGQVGLTAEGRVPGDDVVSQTKQALENVRTVIEAAGCTMRDIVRLQTFLTRSEDIPGFMKARGKEADAVAESPPARNAERGTEAFVASAPRPGPAVPA